MSLINKPFTFTVGAVIIASEHNSNFDTIFNWANGDISNANISASALISDTKLDQVTSAGKVSGAALTSLSSTPSGAGFLPGGNGGSPTGAIMQWPIAIPPTGWLLCDGSAISRVTYVNLFNVISTLYGIGDGSTTFNLPDIKRKTIVMLDGTETEFDTLGKTGGEKTHTLTTPEMPAHTHVENVNNGVGGGLVTPESTGAASAGGTAAGISTASTGGGGAHNNLQPYIVLNSIIKT